MQTAFEKVYKFMIALSIFAMLVAKILMQISLKMLSMETTSIYNIASLAAYSN